MNLMYQSQSTPAARRILTLVWRGWTKACPMCGTRGLFRGWVTLRDHCPNCDYEFDREEGYWTGAMAANIIVTEFAFVALMILAFVFTWPDPPVREIIIGAVLFNLLFPVFFYPFSKTIWMAFDLAFRPREGGSDDR